MLEGNEQVYTLREPGSLDELVSVPASTPEQLEVSLGFWGASSCLGAGGTLDKGCTRGCMEDASQH